MLTASRASKMSFVSHHINILQITTFCYSTVTIKLKTAPVMWPHPSQITSCYGTVITPPHWLCPVVVLWPHPSLITSCCGDMTTPPLIRSCYSNVTTPPTDYFFHTHLMSGRGLRTRLYTHLPTVQHSSHPTGDSTDLRPHHDTGRDIFLRQPSPSTAHSRTETQDSYNQWIERTLQFIF